VKEWTQLAGFSHGKLGGQSAAGEGLAGIMFSEKGHIMVLAQVAEDQGLDLGGQICSDVFAGRGIGKVAFAREDPLLDGPRNGPDLKH
jgi:hypothetical protein